MIRNNQYFSQVARFLDQKSQIATRLEQKPRGFMLTPDTLAEKCKSNKSKCFHVLNQSSQVLKLGDRQHLSQICQMSAFLCQKSPFW